MLSYLSPPCPQFSWLYHVLLDSFFVPLTEYLVPLDMKLVWDTLLRGLDHLDETPDTLPAELPPAVATELVSYSSFFV